MNPTDPVTVEIAMLGYLHKSQKAQLKITKEELRKTICEAVHAEHLTVSEAAALAGYSREYTSRLYSAFLAKRALQDPD